MVPDLNWLNLPEENIGKEGVLPLLAKKEMNLWKDLSCSLIMANYGQLTPSGGHREFTEERLPYRNGSDNNNGGVALWAHFESESYP
ncbi:hypothetical protein AVEN_204434-1 [Araneus ventricosus]|uniref:Uncharacterized protein n=1 Tax=Araneus ventricosus TaxID=182803 RepID=A0A4Y2TQQ4_ARAVE|nr:hypothetical protein AVEN_204434-1 [Araneus ventricosus]